MPAYLVGQALELIATFAHSAGVYALAAPVVIGVLFWVAARL